MDAANIKSFIAHQVREGLMQRDLIISADIDETYLQPLFDVWSEYGIGKREIVFLAILIAHNYSEQIENNPALECKKVNKGRKTADLGRLSDFSGEELTFIISVLISKHGLERIITQMGDIWGDIRNMAEQGLKVLYCKVYQEKNIETAIFDTIKDMDNELKF